MQKLIIHVLFFGALFLLSSCSIEPVSSITGGNARLIFSLELDETECQYVDLGDNSTDDLDFDEQNVEGALTDNQGEEVHDLAELELEDLEPIEQEVDCQEFDDKTFEDIEADKQDIDDVYVEEIYLSEVDAGVLFPEDPVDEEIAQTFRISYDIDNSDQITIVMHVRPISIPRGFGQGGNTLVFGEINLDAGSSTVQNANNANLRGIGIRNNGRWFVNTGRSPRPQLFSTNTAFTANTDFIAVIYDNINREVRFIVNDAVYSRRSETNSGVWREEILNGTFGIDKKYFEVSMLRVYDGILSAEELEIYRGESFSSSTVNQMQIFDRLSCLVAQDVQRASSVASMFYEGAEFVMTRSTTTAYDQRGFGRNPFFEVLQGDIVRLGENYDSTLFRAWQRVSISNANGSVGYIDLHFLRFGAIPINRDVVPPSIFIGEEFIEALVATGRMFGFMWYFFLLFLVVFLVLLYLGSQKLYAYGEISENHYALPGKVLTIGLCITLIAGAILLPSAYTIMLEIRWFFSEIRLLPFGFRSFMSWMLYITIGLYFLCVLRAIKNTFGAAQNLDIKKRLCVVSGLIGLMFFWTVISLILTALVALLIVILVFLVITIAFVVISTIFIFKEGLSGAIRSADFKQPATRTIERTIYR